MADTGSVIKIRADASQVVSEFGKLRAATQQAYQAIDRSAESFKELASNQRAMKTTARISSAALKELKNTVVTTGKNIDKANLEVKSFRAGLKTLSKQFGSAGMRAHQFSRDLRSVGLAVRNSGKNLQFMGRSIMIGMLPFANAIRKASNFAKSLEQAEIRFVKITNLTREAGGQFDDLSASFEKLSNAFGVSRDLITDIATDFALVGMPVSQVDTLARASNELAILGSIDVGPAKDILTSTVFAMRNMATLRGETLSFNDAIKQATGQMYLFNIVNNNTAMAISDMATAIPKLVPITVQFGLTVTEAAGALAAMKASGVSAAEGTVALRTGLLRLTSLTKQADEKVEMARSTLKDFNFEAGVGIETLANFGQSLLAIRTELGDAAAFDIVKNILGIRQTAKVQLFVMDMQSAENQIHTVKNAMQELGGAEVFGSTQINNMTEFARASREPSEEMKQAANDLLKDATKMEDVTSQFLRSLIIQMSGVENAQKDSMEELNKVLESDAFKMQQAKTAMKNALTEMGGLINTMIVDHILPLVQHWVNAFKAMPDGVKKAIVILAALVAAFGPVLYMLAIMKMAFGQTMQIMAGAIGRFFSGFTAAGRAAIIAANEEAVAVQFLAASHEVAAAAAQQQAIAEYALAGALSTSTKASMETAAAEALETASHNLDTAAAAKNTLVHRQNVLVKMIKSPIAQGIGRVLKPALRPVKAVGRGLAGAAGMAMHPVRSIRTGARGVERFMHGARGGALPFGRAGRAGARVGSARAAWRAGRAGTAGAARGAGGQFIPHTRVSRLARGQIGKATKGLGAKVITGPWKKGLDGITKLAGKFGKALKQVGPILSKLFRPIKMIKTIFMSFNPWVLGFMLLLGAVAAIWVTIKKNFVTFKEAAQPGLDALKEAWLAIESALGEVMNSIFQVFNRLKFGGKEGADSGTQMGNVFKVVFQGIAFAMKGIALLFRLLAKIISVAMDFATPYLNYFLGLLTAVINVVKAIVALVKGDFSGAWTYAKRAIGAVLLALVSMVDGVMNFIIDSFVRLMDAAAGVLELIGKIPKFGGWAKDLAEEIKGAGDSMQDFGEHALDGVRDTIASATGIEADELIQIGDADVRNIGQELGGVLGKGVAEGFDDEMDYAAPGMHEAINDAAKAGREEADAFADAYASAFQKFVAEVNKQIRKQMSNAIKFIMDQFDAQTESVTSAFDAQIEAINEVIKEEQRLSKEIAYQTKRREQIRDMALRRDAYRRNRALAIYEGRIDDARSLDLKERRNKEDADQKLVEMDTKHGETLLAQQRADTIELINEQKKAYETLREDMKTELDGVLTELTRFTPKNKEEWNLIVDQIDGEITRIVGDGESDGLMGRLKSAYHPSMGDMPTFDWGGIFDTAVEDAKENMREIYEWSPGTMEADGPFQWLFDEFAKVETEFTTFEEMIKTWKDRLKDALLGESEGTREALFMATKGLTDIAYGGGYESDMPAQVARTIVEYANTYQWRNTDDGPLFTDRVTTGEMDREYGWVPTTITDPTQPVRAAVSQVTGTPNWQGWGYGGGSTGGTATGGVAPTVGGVSLRPDWYAPDDDFAPQDTGGGGSAAARAIRAGLGLDNVKEPLKARVVRMAMEAAKDGIEMTVSGRGGYRDPADQIALFKQRYSRQGPGYQGGGEGDKYWDGSWWKHISGAEVGTPGRSLHERGEAVDISGPSGKRDERWAWMKANAKNFDLWAPITKEPWHHAREGIRNVWSLATGGLVGGLHNQSKMAMLHGGEFVMSARATRNIGMGALSAANSFSQFTGPNEAGGGVTNTSSSNVTIHVETFVGQREWFEKMMSDYNIHIAPSSERARGIEKRTVGSYTERNTRSRV